jgi:hypothetical protein
MLAHLTVAKTRNLRVVKVQTAEVEIQQGLKLFLERIKNLHDNLQRA